MNMTDRQFDAFLKSIIERLKGGESKEEVVEYLKSQLKHQSK